jgi:NitT/TauT family transport system substrate-binding protein
MSKEKNVSNRRDFLKTSAIGLGAVLGGYPLLQGCSKSPESSGSSGKAGSKKVTSCYLPITDATPIILAHELGYYRELGLESDKPVLIRG